MVSSIVIFDSESVKFNTKYFFFYMSECDLQFRCNPHVKRPVCGTNGVTYINGCFLAQAICRSNGKIEKARNGKCCKNRCAFTFCDTGRRCDFNFKTCQLTCPCLKTCANTKCPHFGQCEHDSKTCKTECSKDFCFLLVSVFANNVKNQI